MMEAFERLNARGKKEFLDFCTGKTLLPLTYDKIFKKIFGSDDQRPRLGRFLTAILGFEVTVLHVLPSETEQLNKEGSIMLMDIIVKTEEDIVINVEMQRIAYLFSGKRASCYLSDMIVRQYNDVKSKVRQQKALDKHAPNFNYNMLKPVYCLVFFNESGKNMKELPDIWEDRGKIVFDSGLEEEFLENIHYIELDKFRKNVQTISNEKEKWVSLLSADTPEKVQEVAAYSEEMFEIISEVAEYTSDMKEVMDMFSEALYILDRNTEKYMIDEAQKEIERLTEKAKEMQKQYEEIQKQSERIQKQSEEIQKQSEEIQKQSEEIQKQSEEIQKQSEEKDKIIEELKKQLQEKN